MGDNLDIRNFRNAGQTDKAEAAKKSNRAFYSCLIAIPMIAGLAGVGYKPIMEMRSDKIAAAQAAETPTTDIRQMFEEQSASAQTRSKFAGRPLTPNEFLSSADAKAHGFSPLEVEMLKYQRTQFALTTCYHRDVKKYYTQNNAETFQKLKAKADVERKAQRKARHAEMGSLALPKIENKTQALAFVASGGMARQQKAAMQQFSNFSKLTEGTSEKNPKFRHERFDKRQCSQVRTIVQSGAVNLKTNIPLRK